jgi:heme exporter protein B
MSLLGQAGRVAWKDLRIELRSKEILFTMVFFGALIVVVYTVAFPRNNKLAEALARAAAPGMLWAAIAFAGTVGLGRAFDRERENDTMRSLLLAPVPRLSIFLGKALGIWVLIVLVAVVCTVIFTVLGNVPLLDHPGPLLLVIVLGALGFANVGTIFAATLLKVRSRDILFPVIVYPILIPMFYVATLATESIIAAKPAWDTAWYWIGFLGIYDAVFLVVSVWTFESVVIE